MSFSQVKKCLFALNVKYQEWGELLFRLVLGLWIFRHGFDKLTSFSEKMDFFPDPLGIGSTLSLGLATFAEFFCGILLVIGCFTRFAAFNLLTTMLVAGLVFHATDPFAKKELALLYAAGFFYFLLAGGNRFSMDHWIRKNF